MRKNILPVAAMEKLLKKSGAARVSQSGKDALRNVLEEYAEKIGKKSVEFARHSGRKTIKASDVKLASKE